MNEICRKIEEEKLFAIINGLKCTNGAEVEKALYDGGVRLMAAAFDAAHPEIWAETVAAMREAAARNDGEMCVGAASVLELAQVELTKAAGGSFIISPVTCGEVIRKARELGLVVIAGAQTATEAMHAWRAGADYVSLFPAGTMGSKYFLDIKSTLRQLRMMAFGGLTPGNIAEFADAGCCGYGVSSGIVSRVWIEQGNYARITEGAETFIRAVKKAHEGR